MNTSPELWSQVDQFLCEALLPADAHLEAALKASEATGLPPIQVSACQGKLLQLLVQIQGARRILEIGTLGGYSTICLARGLAEGGKLVTLELEPHHAEVAGSNLKRAGLSSLIELRVGPALESLKKLVAEGCSPFDFIFIDADKPSTPDYLLWALKLSRVGTVIVVDNVIRKGALVEPHSTDPAVAGMRKTIQMLGELRGLSCTALQMVGAKGYDGFAVARVNSI